MSTESMQLACESEYEQLLYELLDAHDDTVRLAASVETDLCWEAHLDYLRQLQRVGREHLARLADVK